jgi:L-glyceraldehyde 3-phosphate reductase
MAISWLLHRPEMTSVIIGPRTLAQLNDCAEALHNTTFTDDELAGIAACK